MTTIDPGTSLPPAIPSTETLDLLARRRSVPAKTMTGPGPTRPELDELLRLASRVPDHRMIVPFRFVVIGADEAQGFAAVLREASGEADESRAKAASLYERGLVTVVAISQVQPDHKTPVWEQQLTAGAACQNLMIAASAAGWSAQWLTGWPAYDDDVAAALSVGANERIAGFIFLGTASVAPEERKRPDTAAVVSHWQAR